MTAETWIDPEILIVEVMSKPLLYAKSMPEYLNKDLKNEAWEDIAKKLSDDWNTLNKTQQKDRSKELQAKWKNIRDNFRREYHAQINVNSGKRRNKKRKYRYFDQLQFLAPYIVGADHHHQWNEWAQEPERAQEPEPEYLSELYDPLCKTEVCSNDSLPDIIDVKQLQNQQRENSASTSDEETLKAVKAGKILAPDEDTTFCLSLVQSLKKMDDESKMSAKIEILKVIRNFSFPIAKTNQFIVQKSDLF